jgi:hypothetical protein
MVLYYNISSPLEKEVKIRYREIVFRQGFNIIKVRLE